MSLSLFIQTIYTCITQNIYIWYTQKHLSLIDKQMNKQYIYICIPLYIHICVYIYIYVCMCVYVYIHISLSLYIYIYIHIHTYKHIHITTSIVANVARYSWQVWNISICDIYIYICSYWALYYIILCYIVLYYIILYYIMLCYISAYSEVQVAGLEETITKIIVYYQIIHIFIVLWWI